MMYPKMIAGSKWLLLALLILAVSCEKDEAVTPEDGPPGTQELFQSEISPEQMPGAVLDIPPASVDVLPGRQRVGARSETSLEPASLEAELKAGECISEHKAASLAASPPKADILFSFDLTGSMYPIISSAKVNALSIMNDVKTFIADARFGVTTFKDYPGSFTGCGYYNMYGGSSDFPYQLDQALTSDVAAVQGIINGLSVGGGADLPESYTRAMYEAYTDAGIGFRPDAKKILLIFGDERPHDCSIGTGPDPGPNATADDADDLVLADVLSEMAANDISMLALRAFGYYTSLWQPWAVSTGGDAFDIGSGEALEEIVQLIEDEVTIVEHMTLEVCDDTYAGWLTSVSPAEFTDLDLSQENNLEFDIEICVPEGTEDGLYEFEVCLVGDGAVFARQSVSITVKNQIEVPVDIKPTSCPNPLNLKSGGLIPLAIAGTADFDVTLINPETVMLEGVPPVRWSQEDVATPFEPFVGKEPDKYNCTEEGEDGYLDYSFKFNNREIVNALGPVNVGDVLILHLTGQLFDGTEIVGEDVMVVVH